MSANRSRDWSPTHPFAKAQSWSAPDFYGDARTWTWLRCSCGRRTACVVGRAGEPTCDRCFLALVTATDGGARW